MVIGSVNTPGCANLNKVSARCKASAISCCRFLCSACMYWCTVCTCTEDLSLGVVVACSVLRISTNE